MSVSRNYKHTVPFTTALMKMKYLGINLRKYVQDLHIKNWKIKQKRKKTCMYGKIYCFHELETHIGILPKLNAIPTKISTNIFFKF